MVVITAGEKWKIKPNTPVILLVKECVEVGGVKRGEKCGASEKQWVSPVTRLVCGEEWTSCG